MPAFLNPAEAEFWVGAGLLIFLAIVIFVAKAPRAVAAALDGQAAKIQSDLDEAARIREEAQRLLQELQAERDAAQRQAEDMLAAAQEQVRLFEADAKAKLEESLARRQKLTEQRIQIAEAQAAADVKAAAAELAAQMAERVLTQRLTGAKSDPLIDKAIGQLAGKLQ
ncbi:MAG: ATP F0F1 synthase subunit B [Phenylobacterium sp. RIFCSPHIGHO2_01_FULL_69_31]|jgi:F-type H+-transporting ATPase subunit b|uniref:F0F1 ATP synthase subunit B n=1 Tax=Phenylobacterium sp. RIFCSPHIGHO2_01_FULL_69_31 TaxID=1801944 RepID=UPI0008ACD26D|nr:F0F1 ATP synthase subunit B [Phenylobacterium sp. RIFCSPHIGHO2_01_FULL_69_31]OHB29353.1 MAG: ATP F0F1 synthase subunit B [Phenylobacterium sp. RIFCSPHIGHO2_01_FULL_69_31]